METEQDSLCLFSVQTLIQYWQIFCRNQEQLPWKAKCTSSLWGWTGWWSSTWRWPSLGTLRISTGACGWCQADIQTPWQYTESEKKKKKIIKPCSSCSCIQILLLQCLLYSAQSLRQKVKIHENMFSHLAYCSCPGCCVFIKPSPGGVTVYPWRSSIAAVEEGIDDFPVIWGDFTTIKSVGEFTN